VHRGPGNGILRTAKAHRFQPRLSARGGKFQASSAQRDGLDLRLPRQADIARMDAAADASADSLVTARDVDLSVAERQAARAAPRRVSR